MSKPSKRQVGVTVQMPAQLHANFKFIVKEKGQSLAFVINKLITQYIADYDRERGEITD